MRRILLALPLVFGLTPGASAQEGCIEQLKFPEQGGWAEYRGAFKQKEPYTMRYAVIGGESREGKELKWLELRTSGNKEGDIVYQMLVPGSPAQLADVREVVMKVGDKPAMKMDGMMLNMVKGQMNKQSFLSDLCKGVTLVGSETVTVPAGKFRARHFHSAEYASDTWVAAGVPFSMVKSTGKDFELSLLRHGQGATSSIKETPQSMGGPPRN